MRAQTRTLFLIVLAVVLGSGLVACKKQRAEIALKKTRTVVADIQGTLDGGRIAPEKLDQINSQIDQANQNLEGNPELALTTANAARSSAEQLRIEVEERYASDLWTQAQEEIRVADINDLPRLDPDRYRRIREVRDEAQTARTDNDWPAVISLSQEIVDEVRTGLASLRNEADRRKIDAEQSLTELRRIGGETYAPEAVIQVRDDINRAIGIADTDRDYQLAINKFAEAKVKSEQGIEKVRREQARERLDQIEGLLTTALIEGAKQYQPEDYQKSSDLYDLLIVDYQEGRYTTVIEGADLLIPDAQRLVIETKRSASDARLTSMRQNIRELEEGGILEYLPGSTQQLRATLTEASEERQRNVEEAFDRIKELYITSSDEFQRIRSQFRDLALDRIRVAKNSLETTRAVFDQMDTLFDPIDGPMTPEQRAFENQKRARQSELGQILEEANVDLGTSDLRQQQDKFKPAIVLAEDVKARSETALNDIYHVVGHNASIELAGLISRYERDGAREYAQEELQRSTELLDQVKGLIGQSQYREAVELSAEARADVELMAQRIAGRATEELRTARRGLDSARSEKTRKYRSSMLDEVSGLIGDAEQHLQEKRLKLAVETAKRAGALAKQAETESNMLAASDQIDAAQGSIEKAQTAQAELYAGREMEDARKLLSSARTLYSSADYVKAEELAASSDSRATDAIYKKINEAEAVIATAKAVGGWEYDDKRLSEANTRVREARAAIETQNYQRSEQLAESARDVAADLVDDAKDHNYHRQVSRIKKGLKEGTSQGVNFFQPENSKAIRLRLAELQNEYSRPNYERVMTQLVTLEGELRQTLNTTDVLVETVADQQERRLENLVEAGAVQYAAWEVANARDHLRYARLDYRRGLYKAAHSNLDHAIKLIDSVAMRSANQNYMNEIQHLYDEYRKVQLQFANVLTLAPVELRELAVGTNGAAQAVAISAQITPMEFRAGVDELYSRALIVRVPPGLERIQESVIKSFAEGRAAALNFEKLAILNRFATRTALSLIDQAYMRMNESNRIVAQVQRELITEEKSYHIVLNEAARLVNY